MENYQFFKNEFIKIIEEIQTLLTTYGINKNNSFTNWEKTINIIKMQLLEEVIRISVVGTIKSGKSTFLNSLLKGDYLKRGAGVITSMLTRISMGNKTCAKLTFKSLEQINSDINNAMSFFNNFNNKTSQFDIKNNEDKTYIYNMISSLNTEQLITNDLRNTSVVILNSYLKGYDRLKDIISQENLTKEYKDSIFEHYRDIIGDENLAVFLNDAKLEINKDIFSKDIEIADCQGSDSSNPLHIAMICDYLILTNFIIYVISSRTGLREADIKFLTIIKKMGIIDNIIFIINIDFNEHDSYENLIRLIEKIKEEISIIKSDPKIFAFSALYNLFGAIDLNLIKDITRFEQWNKEKDLVNFSNKNTQGFEKFLNNKTNAESYELLFKNNIGRINLVLSGMNNWIKINREIVTRDKKSAYKIIENMNHHHKEIEQIKSNMKNALDGVVQKIKNDCSKTINNFFDDRYGELFEEIKSFIQNYNFQYEKYETKLNKTDFTKMLFFVFHEFKQYIDNYMTNSINPKIIGFIINEERKAALTLESMSNPYDTMLKDILSKYNNFLSEIGITEINYKKEINNTINLETIKNMRGLKFPPASAIMDYSAKIKTEAILRLGFYKILYFFKTKILKKYIHNQNNVLALKDIVSRMKKEILKSISVFFKNYKENIKYQYLFKVIDESSNYLYGILLEYLNAYAADLSKTIELINKNKEDKNEFIKNLDTLEQNVNIINSSSVISFFKNRLT